MTKQYEAVNWNRIEDYYDKVVWEKLVQQFWVDTRVPLNGDMLQWKHLPDQEKELINYVFGGLTLLDTLQSEDGIEALRKDAKSKHEEAVLSNIQFMEAIHAKSYSTIFSTFNSSETINEVFEWVKNDKHLQFKANTIDEVYKNGSPLQKKAASVLLESFLFYSGFYTPLKYRGESKLLGISEIILLIIRDESVHANYIGTKFRNQFNKLSEDDQIELKMWVYDLTTKLYLNETEYTKNLYASTDWTPKVLRFIEYNANKALQNLGLDPLFPTTAQDVDPVVLNGLSTSTANHDFFSQVGNGYLVGHVKEMNDDDYQEVYNLAK